MEILRNHTVPDRPSIRGKAVVDQKKLPKGRKWVLGFFRRFGYNRSRRLVQFGKIIFYVSSIFFSWRKCRFWSFMGNADTVTFRDPISPQCKFQMRMLVTIFFLIKRPRKGCQDFATPEITWRNKTPHKIKKKRCRIACMTGPSISTLHVTCPI